MRPSDLAKPFIRCALVMAAVAGALPSADAAVYRGRFTPDYGTPFPDLYWNGTVEVYAPDSCIPSSPGSISLLSCSGIDILSATVNLYDKSDKNTVLQTMDFSGVAGAQLNGLNWLLGFGSDENLISANSTAFPAIQGQINQTIYPLPTDSQNQAWFSLQFLGNYAQLYWFDKEPLDHDYFGVVVPDEVVLTAGYTFDNPFRFGPPTITIGGVCRQYGGTTINGLLAGFVNPDRCGWSDPDGITAGAFIQFERVPEPGSLALVPLALAALGVAGLVARRRRLRKP